MRYVRWLSLISVVLLAACGNVAVGLETAPAPTVTVAPTQPAATVPAETQPAATDQPAATNQPAATQEPAVTEPAPAAHPLAGLVYLYQESVWIITPDGQPRKLRDGQRGLVISPDGRYGLLAAGRDSDQWLVDLATGEERNLTNTPNRFEHSPQWWPGDPDSILVFGQPTNSSGQPSTPGLGYITQISLTGEGSTMLDETALAHTPPAIAPDGQTIAYDHGSPTVYEDGRLQPWLYHRGQGPEPFDYLGNGLGAAAQNWAFGYPAWSPDGRRLAWVVTGDLAGDGRQQAGLAVFDLEARTAQVLQTHVAGVGSFVWLQNAPRWSPDGRWLAWTGWPEGEGFGTWIIPADGSPAHFLPGASDVVWKPASTWLSYQQGPERELFDAATGATQPASVPEGSLVWQWLSTETAAAYAR